MSFRSQASLRLAASLAALLVVSACSDDRLAQLSEVQVIDIPVADAGPQANQNISNPTLEIPETFPVADGDQLTLVWSEEFNGPEIDPEVWFFATGDGTEKGLPGGWGNNELQYYLPDNAMIVNGVLEITARRETVGDLNYTSARINTEDRFAFKYGRIEASMKLPAGQGIWPAFWMLSQDSDYLCDGEPCVWAAIGEIDIMEAVNLGGTGGNEIYGTLHYGGEGPARIFTGDKYTPSVDVTADFHTYALEWDEFEIRWYFDGQLYSVQNSWDSSADGKDFPAPFDQPFHILLNVAVGGNFPGSPNGTTPFPTTMEVDWVRVYSGEEPDGEPPTPADPGIIPDDVIYASDPNETVDIVFGVDYADFSSFGSGSTFNNNVTSDADFNPAFGVTTGNGYDAQVGQFALVGFSTGFAAGYATLDFKVKGLNEDVIRVKLVELADSNYVDITLTSSSFATDLGNGWYQVSVPITSFGNAATADGLLFETGGTAPANAYTFLLTDFGFSGTAGGGDTGGGGTVLVTFDEVTPPVVTEFGGAAYVIEAGPAGGDGNSLNIVRNGGDVFAGAWVAIPAIPSDAGTQTVSALVYSPMAGIPMVAKAEFDENAGTGDVQANETVVVGWQTLTWTFTNLDPAQVYNRFTMLPNLGTVDMPATSYFFDNITLLDAGGSGGGGGGGGGTGGTGEIAVNGGFESGDFSGWETFPGGGTQAIITDNPASGTYAVNLNVPVRTQTDPPVDNVIKIANLEAGNLTPGASVTVSFDMRGSLSGVGGVVFAELFSELSGGGTSKAEILSGGPLTPTTPWTNYSFTTTLGPDVSGGVTLQLKASCGPVEGCGVDVFFDNISIVIGDGGDTGGGDTGGGGDGEELAVNGDFETGDLTGWTADSTTGGLIEVVDTGASGGTYAVHLVAGATQSPLIKQVQLAAGAVMPNSTVTVSFDMKGTITGVGGVVFAEFFSEGNSVAQQFLGGGPIFPTAEWATYTYTVTTGPDVSQGITLQFVAVCGAEECGVDVFFDNVSITAVLGDAGGGDTGVAGGSCGGSEEQASNCDFESGDLTGWTVFDNGGLIEVVDTGTGAGANAAHLVAGPSNNPLIKQFELAAGTVMPGDTVNISFDMRGTLSGEGGVVFAEFFSEGDETTGEILTGGPIFPTFSWATYTYTVTAGADVSRGITFQLAAVCGAVDGCGVDVFFDNVSIVIPGVNGTGGGGGGDTGGTEPTVAATTPTEAAVDVVSLFSNAYSNVRVGDFSTTWDSADVSDVQVAGDDVKKYVPTGGGTSLGLIGISFENSFAIDGTGYDTLRMDIWTPDVTNLLVKLSDFGGDGLAGANADSTGTSTQTLTQGSWQTISIPFSEFMTNGLMGVTELSQIVLQDLDGESGGSTLYVDNLYFFNSAGSGGGGGAGDTVLITFDESTPPTVTPFVGAVATLEAGPAGGGSDETLKILRDGGGDRAGVTILFPNVLVPGPGTQTISAEFYSPTAGIPVVAVMADANSNGTGDVLQNETVVVGWQTLTWTFINLGDADYDKIAFIPNEGTVDATAISYFFDNITLLDGGGTVLITFDESTPPTVTPFVGAVATLEAGPAGGGSDETLKILRDGGGDRAGVTILFPNVLVPGPGTQTISAEFYSPTAGIPVVAVMADANSNGTGDVLQNETVVVGWQTLTWTFINLGDADYDKIAFIPNEGTVDATAISYFFDNITLLASGGG